MKMNENDMNLNCLTAATVHADQPELSEKEGRPGRERSGGYDYHFVSCHVYVYVYVSCKDFYNF